ncbi:MAG: 16S rRNA (cytosine(967)-C(5))-methyltransferase [Chroococcales cyanobacterium]
MINSRQLAFTALQTIEKKGAYTDVSLDRVLRNAEISSANRGLVTELVYGCVRRRRSLDALIDQLGKKKARQQPPNLRILLYIGLYQLRYLDSIPPSAAVHTTVELAKANHFGKLAGVVNGILRQYLRLAAKEQDPLQLPSNSIERLGILYSFPDWILEIWLDQFGETATEQLCQWFNSPPTIDLRVNPLKTTVEAVEKAIASTGVSVSRIPQLPNALRLSGKVGFIQQLPGFDQGEWTVQDSSAQLVSYLLNPQPGEVIVDACAAPGGKTTHIAELIGDNGKIWACDRTPSRLKKVSQNTERLDLHSIEIRTGDSRTFSDFRGSCDRVLVDAPCSGLGTLHKRPDLRWRQTLEATKELSVLQRELLDQAATWIKPGGILVYATCTLNPLENEDVISAFLGQHPNWEINFPEANSPAAHLVTPQGTVKVLPHEHSMDGFFIAKLKHKG